MLFHLSDMNVSFAISGQMYVLTKYRGRTATLPVSPTGHMKAIGLAVRSSYFAGKCAIPTGTHQEF